MKPKLFALALIFCFALGGKALAFNFTDVWPGSYCFEAVVWAVENGITNGTGNGTFAPNNPCTQGQFLLFLWRAGAWHCQSFQQQHKWNLLQACALGLSARGGFRLFI